MVRRFERSKCVTMGKDRGQTGSRTGQRDGMAGDVTPRTHLTEVGAFTLGRKFLAAPNDDGAVLTFIGAWASLSAKEQEAVVLAAARHFTGDVAKYGVAVMWEEVNRLHRIWSNRPWDKTPEAIDALLNWLREQQESLLASDPGLRAEVARFAPTGNAAPVAA